MYPAAARASSCCDKNVGSNLIVSEFLEIGLTWSPLNFLISLRGHITDLYYYNPYQ